MLHQDKIQVQGTPCPFSVMGAAADKARVALRWLAWWLHDEDDEPEEDEWRLS